MRCRMQLRQRDKVSVGKPWFYPNLRTQRQRVLEYGARSTCSSTEHQLVEQASSGFGKYGYLALRSVDQKIDIMLDPWKDRWLFEIGRAVQCQPKDTSKGQRDNGTDLLLRKRKNDHSAFHVPRQDFFFPRYLISRENLT